MSGGASSKTHTKWSTQRVDAPQSVAASTMLTICQRQFTSSFQSRIHSFACLFQLLLLLLLLLCGPCALSFRAQSGLRQTVTHKFSNNASAAEFQCRESRVFEANCGASGALAPRACACVLLTIASESRTSRAQKCHGERSVAKFFGACNEAVCRNARRIACRLTVPVQKRLLDQCLQAAFDVRRKEALVRCASGAHSQRLATDIALSCNVGESTRYATNDSFRWFLSHAQARRHRSTPFAEHQAKFRRAYKKEVQKQQREQQ